MPDLVIRGGLVVDGTGAPARSADVALDDGVVTAVGDDVGRGRRELNADGLLVTPGFVDPHTHYDGQATWDSVLLPSSEHGVTSAVMGNCGVGFAPVAPDRHDWLISMMEGVEDIPGTALHEGLTWGWESFGEYLDVLDARARTMDVGTHLPHAALRGYVMGDRGADLKAVPTGEELARMTALAAEAVEAGAIGISTSRTEVHRTSAGENLGTMRAGRDELLALAAALAAARAGVFQLISDSYRSPDDDWVKSELDLLEAIAATSGRPVSFTVQQSIDAPDRWRDLLAAAERLSASGLDVKAQVAPRPIGMLLGLQSTVHPFSYCRPYRRVTKLPLPERLAALRDPARRDEILASHAALTAGDGAFSGLAFLGRTDDMYVLEDPVDYDLDAGRSLGAEARRLGVDPAAHLYDVLLRGDGRQLVYAPFFNFADGNLDAVREMLGSPAAMFGLSDAGAHCGYICDASMTTSYLSVWGRDRKDRGGMPVEAVVHQLTQRPAAHVGWLDRGVLAPGYLADVNVIDLDALGCSPPELVTDLPAGGRRLVQRAHGYRWTIKRGKVTVDGGQPTGEHPGRLMRGGRPTPVRS